MLVINLFSRVCCIILKTVFQEKFMTTRNRDELVFVLFIKMYGIYNTEVVLN